MNIEEIVFDECWYSYQQYHRLKNEKGEFDPATKTWYGRFCGLFEVICRGDDLIPKYHEFVQGKVEKEKEEIEE